MSSKISTGVNGLDEILNGGLISRFGYLVRGVPEPVRGGFLANNYASATTSTLSITDVCNEILEKLMFT